MFRRQKGVEGGPCGSLGSYEGKDTGCATRFVVSGAPRKAILGPNLQSSCLTRLVD